MTQQIAGIPQMAPGATPVQVVTSGVAQNTRRSSIEESEFDTWINFSCVSESTESGKTGLGESGILLRWNRPEERYYIEGYFQALESGKTDEFFAWFMTELMPRAYCRAKAVAKEVNRERPSFA